MKKTFKYLIFLVLSGAILVTVWYAVSFARSKAKPPIIVLLIDAVRADHLGFFGYERDTSPVIDSFAREAIAFTRAISPAPWTPVAVTSIFTGLYPSSHGFMPPNILWDKLEEAKKQNIGLSNNANTLAERLKEAGYETIAISTNPWIGPDFNTIQGFDRFRHINRASASEVSTSAINALKRTDKNKPFFLYLHYLDAHEPYTPPEKYKDLFTSPLTKAAFSYSDDAVRDIGLYDAEIRYMDTAIGKFFGFLKEQGLYDRSVIVVVADHGEQFGEHGNLGHGYQLFTEELHVPLFIKPAGKKWRASVVDDVVSTIDLAPTLQILAGLIPDPRLQAAPLLSKELLRKESPPRDGVLSEIRKKYYQSALTATEGKRLIMGSKTELDSNAEGDYSSNVVGLFDLSRDPLEQKPLNDPALLAEMRENLQAALAEAKSLAIKQLPAPSQVSSETLKQLESLGYMK